MSRPCACDRVRHGEPYAADQCRVCWLYHHVPEYRARYDGTAIPEKRSAAYQELLAIPAGPPATEPVGTATAASLAGQAWQAGVAYARWAAAGLPVLDAEQVARRRAACDACDQRDPEQDRCRACGCYLSGVILNKIRMATEDCPLGRWPV